MTTKIAPSTTPASAPTASALPSMIHNRNRVYTIAEDLCKDTPSSLVLWTHVATQLQDCVNEAMELLHTTTGNSPKWPKETLPSARSVAQILFQTTSELERIEKKTKQILTAYNADAGLKKLADSWKNQHPIQPNIDTLHDLSEAFDSLCTGLDALPNEISGLQPTQYKCLFIERNAERLSKEMEWEPFSAILANCAEYAENIVQEIESNSGLSKTASSLKKIGVDAEKMITKFSEDLPPSERTALASARASIEKIASFAEDLEKARSH